MNFNLLYNLLPEKIQSKILNFSKRKLTLKNIENKDNTTFAKLERKHFKNCRLILDRNALLDSLPKNGIVAEMGVDQGNFSEEILRRTTPEKLYLIDLWNTKEYSLEKKAQVQKRFHQELKKDQIQIINDESVNSIKKFHDNYFDWIYIDTSHSYEQTLNELLASEPKIKNGGYITGHDFVQGNWNFMIKYGVIKAVYEFCKMRNWEIVFLTVDKNENSSFALKKIKEA